MSLSLIEICLIVVIAVIGLGGLASAIEIGKKRAKEDAYLTMVCRKEKSDYECMQDSVKRVEARRLSDAAGIAAIGILIK